MPKRQLHFEELLFRLGNRQTFPPKVALVLEWSLAGVAIRRSCTEPVQLQGPST